MATSNIIVAAGSTLPTPPVGEATLFIDTENNNILSLKKSDGSVVVYSESNAAECCSCEIAKKYMEDIACALKSGMLNASQFATMIDKGLVVTSNETTDVDGNKTCTVSIGPKAATPTGITISNPGSVSLEAGTVQLTKTVTPVGANEGVVWVSLTPANGTIDQTGLFTPLVAGTTTTVEAYSVVDPTVKGSRVISIVP